jgi:hypothetical protein
MTHLCSLQVWPEHIDHQNPEDQQVPSPAEEKQISKVGEKKRSWMKPLLRSVALGLSLMDVYASIVLVIYSLSPYRALFLENPSKDRSQHCQKVCLQLETLHILIACQNMIHEFERRVRSTVVRRIFGTYEQAWICNAPQEIPLVWKS